MLANEYDMIYSIDCPGDTKQWDVMCITVATEVAVVVL